MARRAYPSTKVWVDGVEYTCVNDGHFSGMTAYYHKNGSLRRVKNHELKERIWAAIKEKHGTTLRTTSYGRSRTEPTKEG